jgi:hypothetical protein
MNEGISYPVEDTSIEPFSLVAYGGHGICMAFWGVTDGVQGHMAIIETPDDASIRIERLDGLLAIAPQWDAQRGKFGYARRLRYVFFDQGGHVSIAKRYRAHAQKTGLLKTLEEKRRENPNVDLLIGAVNVWCWERDAVPIVKEMQAAGIERILWSNVQSPENLRAERHRCAHEPVRYLPGRDGSGEFSQAQRPARRLGHGSLACGHHSQSRW